MVAGIWSSTQALGAAKSVLLGLAPPIYAVMFGFLYYLTLIDEVSQDANIMNPSVMAAYLG